MPNPIASSLCAVAFMALSCLPLGSPHADATYVADAGLGIEVVNTYQPSFVAYFTIVGGRWWVYNGDTGWIYASPYDVTVRNWSYSSTPLVLAAYRGVPGTGTRGIVNIGNTMVDRGRIVSW